MGVLDRPSTNSIVFGPNRRSESEVSYTSDEYESGQGAQLTRGPRHRGTLHSRPLIQGSGLAGRRRGARNRRRNATLCEMMEIAGLEEIAEEVEEPPAHPLPSQSSFQQLFQDTGKMKMWHEFVELSEHEQKSLLSEDMDKDRGSDNIGEVIVAKKSLGQKNFKGRRRLPLDFINHIETELKEFFDMPSSEGFECDDGVYVASFQSPYYRFILHGVCQNLGLVSHSYTQDGIRHTTVERCANNDFCT